jgi:gliding motility-associated-like protein
MLTQKIHSVKFKIRKNLKAHCLLFCAYLLLGSIVKGQSQHGISYIENKGQWPEHVHASADIGGGKVFVEEQGFTYHLYDLSAIRESHDEGKIFNPEEVRIRGHVYRVKFENAHTTDIHFREKKKTYYNYFLGQDENKWAGGCASFRGMLLPTLYDQIDMHVYSNGPFMKYDMIVRPGGDPNQIMMNYEGIEQIKIDQERLIIRTSIHETIEQKPIAYQIISGIKKDVKCAYKLIGHTVTFDFPDGYNKKEELIIDPELVFSTYSGSFSDNFGYTATYDEDGYLYSGSSAFGQNYPTTTGSYQTTHHGGDSGIEDGIDMALSKYDVSGTFMVWSTFLGGNGDDLPHSIITNSNSELLVYGSTGSNNFPVTAGAIQTTFEGGSLVAPTGTGANFPNGTDIVVAHFNQSCTDLIGSTYIGGSSNDGVCTSVNLKKNYADEFRGEISLDDAENILIVSSTFSFDFPVENAFQPLHGGSQDAVIMKLDPTLDQMIWGTFFGGTGDDSGFSVSANTAGELYVCGGTTSNNLSIGNNGIQPTFGGGTADGYVLRIQPNGQSIMNGTYWGSSLYDQLYFIEIDEDEQVYVFGQTNAAGSTMIINAVYGTADSGNLITKFSPSLNSVTWSTVFGTGNSKPNLSPSAFLVDYCNRIYISGWGVITVNNNSLNPGANLHSMNNLETTPDAFDNTCSTGDFYMAVFDENMTQLEYATFFGGGTSSEHVDGGTSRFDRKGVIYQSVCAGCGGNSDFPILPANAWSTENNSSCNNGVYKFDFQLPLTVADFTLTPTGCVNTPIQFNNTSTYAQTHQWNFGDEQTSSIENPTHLYTEPGEYEITLIVTHNLTCNGSDTITHTIQILESVNEDLEDLGVCEGEQTQLGPNNPNPNFIYSWQPASQLNANNIPNPTFIGNMDMSYTLTVLHDGCIDVYHQSIDVVTLSIEIPDDTTLCDDSPLFLEAVFTPSNAEIIWSDQSNFSNMLNDNNQDPNILVEVNTPTTFFVQITTEDCELEDEINVNLASFQTVIQGDFTVCVEDTTTLSILEPNPTFEYTWSPETLILSGQNTASIEVFVPEETMFYVNSQSPTGCVAFDSVLVHVSELSSPILSVTAVPEIIVQGQSSQLNVNPDNYSYQWTPSNTLSNPNTDSPIATPPATTTYTVTVQDDECEARTEVTVRVVDFICGPPSIYVPNAFTPNKDARNEKMFVRANNIRKLYFVIYDRWGEKIFETANLASGWDGTFEGRDLEPDVYVYYLEATCAGGDTYFEEGNITLIR